MVEKCRICNEEIQNLKHFYKFHGISLSDYYLKYYKKQDLFTGELLSFKNKDNYLNNDFLNRTNLKRYLCNLPLENAQEYCRQLLIKRKEQKGLLYTPTQVELRTLIIPNVIYFNKLFSEGYYKLCETLGFLNRFKNLNNIYNLENPPVSNYDIFQDTREQKPLILNHPIQIQALPYGDYCLSNLEESGNIFIERKSLNDFVGTLSSGFKRFVKEVEKCESDGSYLIVLVETNLNQAISFNFLPWFKMGKRISSEFIFHNVRNLLQKYLSLQFLFVDGRKIAAEIIKKILFSKGQFKEFDNQLVHDMKLI